MSSLVLNSTLFADALAAVPVELSHLLRCHGVPRDTYLKRKVVVLKPSTHANTNTHLSTYSHVHESHTQHSILHRCARMRTFQIYKSTTKACCRFVGVGIYFLVCACACMCACMCACVRACVCACVRACVRVCVRARVLACVCVCVRVRVRECVCVNAANTS